MSRRHVDRLVYTIAIASISLGTLLLAPKRHLKRQFKG